MRKSLTEDLVEVMVGSPRRGPEGPGRAPQARTVGP